MTTFAVGENGGLTMRLIDADALFLPDEKSDKVYIIGSRSGKTVELAMKLLEKKVANAPTIKAEPVRHGVWETTDAKNGWHYCSECGCKPLYKYPYCPNCGAKMDGGGDE